MATKYQVFVSSTYDDLKDERNAVIRMILELGHIPVGMEMFSAADEEQWQIIARHIDESDYYCVIVGHRYGSVTDGISYTRKEYEYAAKRGIPVLGFIIDDSATWPAGKIDKATGTVQKLTDFKNLVRSKPVSFWTSADDLYGKVSVSLGKQFTMNPREGWVRASSAAGPEVTAELSRLSAENARLREDLDRAQSDLDAEQSAELENLWEKLRSLKTTLSYCYARSSRGERHWEEAKNLTYADLFLRLSHMLASEMEISNGSHTLCMEIREDKDRAWDIVAMNQFTDLLADLMALGLVEPSKKKHAVADTGEYWSLSERGHELHRHMRVALMEASMGGELSATHAKKAPAKKAPAKKAPAKKAP